MAPALRRWLVHVDVSVMSLRMTLRRGTKAPIGIRCGKDFNGLVHLNLRAWGTRRRTRWPELGCGMPLCWKKECARLLRSRAARMLYTPLR
jgi:hypothetical protein